MSTRSGEAIEAIRTTLGVTQEGLAARLGMADGGSYVNKLIKGKRLAGDDLLERLREVAHLSPERYADLLARVAQDRRDRRARRRARQSRPLDVVDAPVATPTADTRPPEPMPAWFRPFAEHIAKLTEDVARLRATANGGPGDAEREIIRPTFGDPASRRTIRPRRAANEPVERAA